MFDERLCMQFGDCTLTGDGVFTKSNGSIIVNREKPFMPGLYRDLCPSKAINVAGEEISVQALIEETEKDLPFYRTAEGGVTLSGGEPFMQNSDLGELFKRLKSKNIHIAVETSLHVPWEKIEPYTGYTDVFLADLKHTDAGKFRQFTGGDLSLVTENFKKINEKAKYFIIRIPVIPGFNMTAHEMESIIDFSSSLKNAGEIHFIPYHSLAKEKYLMMGKDYAFRKYKNVTAEEILPAARYAENKGFKVKII